MILRNKRTLKKLKISYFDFRKKFSKEIQVAFESYRQTELNKYFYKIREDESLKSDFYFDLQWNFNHFGMSNWYIERLD